MTGHLGEVYDSLTRIPRFFVDLAESGVDQMLTFIHYILCQEESWGPDMVLGARNPI